MARTIKLQPVTTYPAGTAKASDAILREVREGEDPNAEKWATVAVRESIPAITDEATFRTHFYDLRKNPSRKYQFEISQGGVHENIVTGVGGRPSGADPRDKAYIYVDIPYSEAGGYIIHVTYELRDKAGLWEKCVYGTLNSAWRDTGWLAAEDRTPLVVTVGKEGSGSYKADYNSSDILAAAQAHRAVIMRYTDTDSGLQTDVLLKGTQDGLPLFYDTWMSKDGKTVNRIDATVDYSANVSVTIKSVNAATTEDLSGYVPTSEKGAKNGVATLGADGKVPAVQLPKIPTGVSKTVSLTVAGWGSGKTQTVSDAIFQGDAGYDYTVAPAPASAQAYSEAGIICTAVAAGSATFTCTTKPATAITANVRREEEAGA